MTVANWLQNSTTKLTAAGISTARLDCLVLLEDQTHKDRSWLLAHPEHPLTSNQVRNLKTQITQRLHHLPLAYLRHKTEFYGRDFYLDHHVLEPRPESETIIDLLKELFSVHSSIPGTIADIGTGSGALAITAKLELPHTEVIATDLDPHCLKVASQNAKSHKTNIKLLQGDLLAALPASLASLPKTEIFVSLCNLPYVPDSFQINLSALNEPRLAIFGGPDGLDLYRRLFEQTTTLSVKPSHILTEALPPQHSELAAIALSAGYTLSKADDFIQLFKRN